MGEPAARAAHGTEVVPGWVVDMENMLGDTDRPEERERWNKHSIYRVPQWIKDINKGNAYKPSLVSLGPLHHGDPDLWPMEEHKRRALWCLVKRSRKPLRVFFKAVKQVAKQLQDAYEERFEENYFVKLMITDGCFLLEAMRMASPRVVDYGSNDPIFSEHGCLYVWSSIRSDMLKMENQLPLLLLQSLLAVERGTYADDEEINRMVLDFLYPSGIDPSAIVDMNRLGLHPLDIFHRSFTNGARPVITRSEMEYIPIPSAMELYECGIHFKSHTNGFLNVQFERGVLSMAKIRVNDDTETDFLNLMAFERLHVGAGNHVTAYVVFMDNIINTTKDVALLSSKGIIVNMLGSEEEVAKLFNTLNKGAVISGFNVLHGVKRQMNDHCRKPWNKWRANLIHTYFRNPWMFISLVAAAILLVASLLETVYSIVSFYRN